MGICLLYTSNNGIEITLNTTPVKIKDFRWDVNFTFTKNKNEIKKIDGQVDENGKPLDDVNNKWFVGYPMNVYYDYVFAVSYTHLKDNK